MNVFVDCFTSHSRILHSYSATNVDLFMTFTDLAVLYRANDYPDKKTLFLIKVMFKRSATSSLYAWRLAKEQSLLALS